MTQDIEKHVETTIAMSSGMLVNPFTMTVEDGQFRIEDIAHALSNQCRYAGHVKRFYSVAEHCLLVEKVVHQRAIDDGNSEQWIKHVCRWALMHDADEAYLPDMPSPFKRMPEMKHYREAGARLMREIATWLGLEGEEPVLVKHVDVEIRGTERHWLFPPIQGWKTYDAIPGVVCGLMTPMGAKIAFLARFRELWPEFAS